MHTDDAPLARAPRAASLGLLMLDTAFPRPVGDIGNPDTFDFPVIAQRVRGATAKRAVHERGEGLLASFVAAGRRLIDRGAVAIGTSCGFLVLHQRALADALPVPVATSSLLQVAWLGPMLGAGQRCGVIAFDAQSLGAEHLAAAGAPPDTPVAGMPRGGALQRAVLGDEPRLDTDAVRGELLTVARELLSRDPQIRALVLECTNLPPYAAQLRNELGVPVYDGRTLLEWLWRGVQPGVER